MPFPSKAKDNALQAFVIRGEFAGVNVVPFLRSRYRPAARYVRTHFNRYFAEGNPRKGAHKRFKNRPDVYLPDSPFDLLQRLSTVRTLTHRRLMPEQFPSVELGSRVHLFDTFDVTETFSNERYFDVPDPDGVPKLRQFAGQLNSAAIAVYPLLHYMGFRDVFCLGMDMSMLGSMEYAALFTFWSMPAYWWFFRRTRHVFNAAYLPNRPYYYRPASEFDDFRQIVACTQVRLTRVYSPWKYAAAVAGVPTMSLDEFAAC
jgi:hypothetical protein